MSKSICSFCFLFLLVLTTLLNPQYAEAGRVVRIGIYEAGALANFDKDGSAHGFFVDMLKHIAEKEQWNVQYVPGTWQEGLDRLKSDKIDMVLCIGYTAEREKYMDFPKEYLLLNWGVLYRQKGSQITSLLELEGKSVSALKGDVYLTGFLELVRQFNVNVKIQEVDQYSKVFKAVESGSVAAGVAGNLYGILNENGRRAEQTPVIFAPIKVGYAVNEGKNGDLITALDLDIAEMKADKASIYHRELENLLSKRDTKIPKEAYWALSGIVAALLLAIAFIILLRRQVRSKTSHLVMEIGERKRAEEALLALKDELQEQNEELQVNEEELRSQNDELQSIEEILRVQINEYESSQKLLKESEESLHRQNSLFSSLLQILPIGVFMVEAPSGKPLVANEAAYNLLGRGILPDASKDNLSNVYKAYKAGTHDPYPPEEMPIILGMSGVSSHIDDMEVERPDGTKTLLEIFGAPVTDDKGNIWASLVSFIDITDRKRAEEVNDKLEAQLQQAQKLESVGRLAGGVAHDFNNMLAVILGHAELGLMRIAPDDPLVADLKEISKTAERSADLTRQLLIFARKQTIAPKLLDLNETVSGMHKMLQRLIGENLHLTWKPAADLWQTKIDPTQVDQILANLCVNARDAIEDTGRITIETENCIIDADYCNNHQEAVPGDYVRLSVSDDGAGMDRETLSHVFEPFYTTKEKGKGTGLGLATVYGAVKQNNGFINIYSEPGQGTTFSIYLPRDATSKSRQSAAEGPAAQVPGGQETILLVEDESAILNITSLMLEKQGYTVLKADTPGKAIELAREHHGEIHLLMTDVIMPEMNGRDLSKNVLSIYPGLKRLFMSGYTADVIAHHGVLDEGVNFIQKPFSLPNMAAMVREVLDNK